MRKVLIVATLGWLIVGCWWQGRLINRNAQQIERLQQADADQRKAFRNHTEQTEKEIAGLIKVLDGVQDRLEAAELRDAELVDADKALVRQIQRSMRGRF